MGKKKITCGIERTGNIRVSDGAATQEGAKDL